MLTFQSFVLYNLNIKEKVPDFFFFIPPGIYRIIIWRNQINKTTLRVTDLFWPIVSSPKLLFFQSRSKYFSFTVSSIELHLKTIISLRFLVIIEFHLLKSCINGKLPGCFLDFFSFNFIRFNFFPFLFDFSYCCHKL